MGAGDRLLRVLASPWMPGRLAEALVRTFAAWQARQLARADTAHADAAHASAAHDSGASTAPPLPGEESGPIYLMDGYHGGIPFWDWLLLPRGGFWNKLLWPAVGEVIVRRAREMGLPAVLEIDGYTFPVMATDQPQELARLREAASAGTIELVNGTYTQPFLRSLSGEAIIRQFTHGQAAIEGALGVEVSSYASQEPCFCAQLPQILSGFGYQWALVRTHWAPFGEEAAHNAPLVRWQGPDGSVVLATPRHTWMDYGTRRDLHPGSLRGNLTGSHTCQWTIDALGRLHDLAVERGTGPPLLSKLEDLSPTESPTADAPALTATPGVKLTTLSGYCRTALADREPKDLPLWQPTADDLPLDLPWGLEGDSLMQARDRAEAALLVAERADAAAQALGRPSREQELDAAWRDLLLAQHHDLHVCGPWLSRAHGKPMSEVGRDVAGRAATKATRIRDAALEFILDRVDTARFDGHPLLVFNPEALPRQAVVTVPLPGDTGAGGTILDGDQALPSQSHGEGLSFLCSLPPFGWRVYELQDGPEESGYDAIAGFEFQNGHLHASLDPDGALTLSSGGRTLLEGGATLRVWRQGRWWESTEGDTTRELVASGPVFVQWRVRGSVGGIGYVQSWVFYRALSRLDATVTLDFGDGAHFGPQPEDGAGYYAADEHKLCACFPLGSGGQVVRDGPFLLSNCTRKRFIGGRWAAVEHEGGGLAVLAPGARGYTHDGESGVLQRVLAWSPSSWIYASDDSVTPGGSRYARLRGQHTFHYALLPYRQRAEVVTGGSRYCLLPPAVVGTSSQGDLPSSGSLLHVEGSPVEMSALCVRQGIPHARLWNASGEEQETIIHGGRGCQMHTVDLRLQDGEHLDGGRLRLRPWGVQTVRLDGWKRT